MEAKAKIVQFFLSRINVDFFSRLIKKYRVLRPFYKLAAQRLIDEKFPHHLFIETTSICNLECKMCPRNSTPMKLGTMEMELFKKIIDEAKNYGERTFSLHLFGEPLLDLTLVQKIRYIKQSNPKNIILLTTNGVMLTGQISSELINNNVNKIAVSIHSPEAKTYQKITGRDELNKVEQNIRELVRQKKEARSQNPKIILRLVRIAENAELVADFEKKWSGWPVSAEIREGHNYGGKISNVLKTAPPKRHPCYHLWFSPGINWDGDVSICCDDVGRQAIIGNVKNSTLAEIWQSETMKKLRVLHLSGQYGKIPICKDCDVWQIYPDIFFSWQKK